MKSLVLIISLLAFILPYAAAHGVVTKVTIDGNVFKGNVPNGASNPSIIRQISDPSPVKGAMNPAVNCGPSAGPAALIGDANPGSVMEFDWTGADFSNWPHNTGPMLTYMASCGSTTCDKFDSTTAKWFKIQQVGRKSNGGDWAQVDLMNGASARINVPSTLKSGNYLIRHEIIALHLATQKGGAEFYPSCTQLRVGGNQTGGPADNELVSLPGAYNDNDPGIFDPQAFDASATYNFPGPAIASFVSNADGTNSASPSASASSSSAKSTSTSKPSSASSNGTSGTCHLKKKPNTNTAGGNSTTTYRPRHISRIMKRLTFGSLH